jgi:hypothetical protein
MRHQSLYGVLANMITQRNESDEELVLLDYSREELKAMQDAKQSLKADIAELEGLYLATSDSRMAITKTYLLLETHSLCTRR